MFSEQPQQCPGCLGRAEGFAGPAVLGSRAHPWGSAHLSHPWEHSGVGAEMVGAQEGVLGLGPGVSVPRTTTGGAGLPATGGLVLHEVSVAEPLDGPLKPPLSGQIWVLLLRGCLSKPRAQPLPVCLK